VVISGLPPFRADFLVNYERPLLEEGGSIGEIGDLAEVEARDTLSVDGLYLHPLNQALDREGGGVQLRVGAPAYFSVTRDREGRDRLWTFRGGPSEGTRRRP